MNERFEKNLNNFDKAFKALEESLSTPSISKKEIAGVIQHFEFVFELSWKTLKSFLALKGVQASFPRDVFEQAFQGGLISDAVVWAKIMDDRNLSVHTYDEKLAAQLLDRISREYFNAFKALHENLQRVRTAV